MKPNQLQLAKCLVAELEVFAEAQLEIEGIADSWITGMLHRGIPFMPSYWSGGQNPRLKIRLVRAADQLEQLGMLKRLTEPNRDRTTHVIPTPELIAGTIDRLRNQVDVDAVVAGLSRTSWGSGVANRLTQIRPGTASVGH
jgi:hypothetical protein